MRAPASLAVLALRHFFVLLKVLLVLLTVAATAVHACGIWPAKHGGVMNTGTSELSFELVHRRGDATVYLEDHGVPVESRGSRGQLRIRQGQTSVSIPLVPGHGNRLTARLPQAIGVGAVVTAEVQLQHGDLATGMFFVGPATGARTAPAASRRLN